MRRLRGLLAATLIAAATTTGASAALPSVQATEAGARFPFRSYVLTLPKGASIGSASVRVTENGVPVRKKLAPDTCQPPAMFFSAVL